MTRGRMNYSAYTTLERIFRVRRRLPGRAKSGGKMIQEGKKERKNLIRFIKGETSKRGKRMNQENEG